MRPSDIYPKMMMEELIRLYKLDPDWCQWKNLDGSEYRCYPRQSTWLVATAAGGADWFAMKASSHWLGGGPKVFKPTVEQCKALEQVSVNLTLEEYQQPFPALMVELDYPPFTSVLVYKEDSCLICCLHSPGHTDDICTTVGQRGKPIEDSLNKFDPDCAEFSDIALTALRVAVNSCLALAHYGCHLNYLFPKEVESDKRLSLEKSERGEKAKKRLPLAMQVVSFSQEIKLHRTEDTSTGKGNGDPAYTVSTHWRRGHWALQPYGEKSTLRKRIFRKPVLVKADLFTGDKSQTVTNYRG